MRPHTKETYTNKHQGLRTTKPGKKRSGQLEFFKIIRSKFYKTFEQEHGRQPVPNELKDYFKTNYPSLMKRFYVTNPHEPTSKEEVEETRKIALDSLIKGNQLRKEKATDILEEALKKEINAMEAEMRTRKKLEDIQAENLKIEEEISHLADLTIKSDKTNEELKLRIKKIEKEEKREKQKIASLKILKVNYIEEQKIAEEGRIKLEGKIQELNQKQQEFDSRKRECDTKRKEIEERYREYQNRRNYVSHERECYQADQRECEEQKEILENTKRNNVIMEKEIRNRKKTLEARKLRVEEMEKTLEERKRQYEFQEGLTNELECITERRLEKLKNMQKELEEAIKKQEEINAETETRLRTLIEEQYRKFEIFDLRENLTALIQLSPRNDHLRKELKRVNKLAETLIVIHDNHSNNTIKERLIDETLFLFQDVNIKFRLQIFKAYILLKDDKIIDLEELIEELHQMEVTERWRVHELQADYSRSMKKYLDEKRSRLKCLASISDEVLAQKLFERYLNDIKEEHLRLTSPKYRHNCIKPERILGCANDINHREVKLLYFRLAREFHPDKTTTEDKSPLVVELAAEVFKMIAESCAILTNK